MSNPIKALIVDDEAGARDVLESLLNRYCRDIEILDKCAGVEEAVEAINRQKPDVVFLDIEMPNYAGYEIVSFFDEVDFDIIFITAYDQYAIKAFELAAVDYLLKPVEIERLKQATEKLHSKLQDKKASEQYSVLQQNLKTNIVSNIIVPYQGGQKVVDITDIIAFEAQSSYTYIHLKSIPKLMVSKNLKHFETVLADNNEFMRVHKSWLINRNCLLDFSKSKLEIRLQSGIIAKLSKYKKAEFEAALLKQQICPLLNKIGRLRR